MLVPVDGMAVAEAGRRLMAEGCDSLALCFLNSFVSGENERAAMVTLRHALPAIPVSVSHLVANEMREYERFSTTVANTFIAPLAASYLGDFGRCIAAECGIAAPVFLMLSSGGLAPLKATREKRFVPESGLPIRIATADLIEIGACGGSVARRDALRLLKVGPRSAGAEPGPACYGRGGAEPTVTDANLALGLLDTDDFAGGTMRLDTAAAETALATLGASLGMDGVAAALGIWDLANENMASAARVHAAERGIDPERLALVVTGGGGPLHGAEVARKLGIHTMLCPPAAGVASALSLCLAPARVDCVRFVGRPLAALGAAVIEDGFAALEREAAVALQAMGDGMVRLGRSADMRYVGQGFEV